jgi:hypothetical protein
MSAIFFGHEAFSQVTWYSKWIGNPPHFERLTAFSPQISVLSSTCRKHAVSPRIGNICDMSVPTHIDNSNDEREKSHP